jgi:hypothetical protein
MKYRIPFHQHQLSMPGVLELAVVAVVVVAWIGSFRSIFRPSGGK